MVLEMGRLFSASGMRQLAGTMQFFSTRSSLQSQLYRRADAAPLAYAYGSPLNEMRSSISLTCSFHLSVSESDWSVASSVVFQCAEISSSRY